LTGKAVRGLSRIAVYPATHYVTTTDIRDRAVEQIKGELSQQLAHLRRENKLLEAQRLEERTRFDLEMMAELGYCHGIENYSRHLTGRAAGEPPPTLLDYFPGDFSCSLTKATLPSLSSTACTGVTGPARKPLCNTASDFRRPWTTGHYGLKNLNPA
jgi:excinuclease UvrABC helicase subunit UvrB